MTELKDGQAIKRLLTIHGIGKVEVTMSDIGLSFRIPKTRKYLTLMWGQVIDIAATPHDVPSWLMGKPRQFLMHEVEKVTKKSAKKAETCPSS